MKLTKLKKLKKAGDREDLIFETNKYVYNFQQLETITFNENIFGVKPTLSNSDEDRSNLLVEIMIFKKNTNPKNLNCLKLICPLLNVEKLFLMLLKVEYFHYHQLKAQVFKYGPLNKCFIDFQ